MEMPRIGEAVVWRHDRWGRVVGVVAETLTDVKVCGVWLVEPVGALGLFAGVGTVLRVGLDRVVSEDL